MVLAVNPVDQTVVAESASLGSALSDKVELMVYIPRPVEVSSSARL